MITIKPLSSYRLLLFLLSPILLLWLCKEAWQQKSIAFLQARLGKTNRIQADHWFHCASVGEVNAISPLIEALQQQDKRLLVTCFTPTGLQQAHRRFDQLTLVEIRLLPIDWQWTLRRFLASVQCTKITLVESEFWPNLISIAHQQGRTLNLINARITDKTLQAPAWWRQLIASQLDEHFQHILCRNAQDVLDLRQLGLNRQDLSVIGNLKWCDRPAKANERLTPKPYVLFASSHAPEELALAKQWQQYPELPSLVIVPRHPKRGQSIAKQLAQAGIAFSRRSISHEHQQGILLADTFGELTTWMAHAELVIMGGSFTRKGGQNPLEAIRLAKLVFSGPDMRDFAEEAQQLTALGALIQVAQFDALMPLIIHHLARPELRLSAAQAGQAWLLHRQTGIIAQSIQILESEHAVS